jgi:putative ABC transport system substrate-binding protein
VELAEQLRLPAISIYSQFAADGGLMAYGPDTRDIFRRSAQYVDHILKGESPADLPVQAPNKYIFFNTSPAATRAKNQMIRAILMSLRSEVAPDDWHGSWAQLRELR